MKSEFDPESGTVLIVGDARGELAVLRGQLGNDFPHCEIAYGGQEGLEQFIELQPSVLVVAFRKIGDAERFYLALLERGEREETIHHQSLLLCKENESQRACELCSDGTFDDYVADWPHFDRYRIRLSIQQAFLRGQRSNRTYKLGIQLEQQSEQMRLLDSTIATNLRLGQERIDELAQGCRLLVEQLARELSPVIDCEENNRNSGLPAESRQAVNQQLLSRLKQLVTDEESAPQRALARLNQWLEGIESAYGELIAPLVMGVETPSRVRVMVIDDDLIYREIVAGMLSDSGFDVISVEGGEEALVAIRQQLPDVILLDYRMPGMDGIETLRRLKQESVTAAIPVVMLTGMASLTVIRESVRAGASDFIVKPSDRVTLVNKIFEMTQA